MRVKLLERNKNWRRKQRIFTCVPVTYFNRFLLTILFNIFLASMKSFFRTLSVSCEEYDTEEACEGALLFTSSISLEWTAMLAVGEFKIVRKTSSVSCVKAFISSTASEILNKIWQLNNSICCLRLVTYNTNSWQRGQMHRSRTTTPPGSIFAILL